MGIAKVFNSSNGGGGSGSGDLLNGLNPEQREVVLHDTGPLLVGAVAGSGKTHALIHRVGYLVTVRNVNPSRILAVTFSKKGADEMQERLDKLIGESDARIGTFHSVSLQILRTYKREYRTEAKEWTVDGKDNFHYCIKDAVGHKVMRWDGADVTLISGFISYCKNHVARPESETASEIAEYFYRKNGRIAAANPRMLLRAYYEAEELRRDRRLLCFDDMLLEAVELMRDDEGIRSSWAKRYDYVLQDEAQDQNLCQLLLGEYLAQDHENYMLVGDPAQTIYTWRGAQPEKLLQFKDKWNAKLITMNRNYRCGEKIITAANHILDSMDPTKKLDMNMICERNTSGSITVLEHDNLDEEGEYIATEIKALLADGHKEREFVILYRTKAQSRAPEEALISHRIPYQIVGGANFYERREVKNLLSYLRLAEGRGTADDIKRAINTPFRFLGAEFIKKVVKKSKESNGTETWPTIIRRVCREEVVQKRQIDKANEWADMMERLKYTIDLAKTADHGTEDKKAGMPAQILEDINMETDYTDRLQKEEGEETPENSRVSNVREMIRAAGRFESVSDLLDYVDKTIAASKKQPKDNPNKVTLCTIHKSKGLEWPFVYLVGAANKILPHARCEDPEEERRLFYVAITRAKDHLTISSARNMTIGTNVLITTPSSFIADSKLTPLSKTSNPNYYPTDNNAALSPEEY